VLAPPRGQLRRPLYQSRKIQSKAGGFWAGRTLAEDRVALRQLLIRAERVGHDERRGGKAQG